jgi:outer membrane lipoprotein-sorting protein
MIIKARISLFILLFLSVSAFAQDSLALNFDTVFARVAQNQIDFKTLAERTTLTWDDGNSAQQFNGLIRAKRDTTIWLSLGMFGFEGARVLISPDSFRLMNKLTSEYLVRDYSFIQSWILMPVNFTMLQQLLAGQAFSINERAQTAAKEDSSLVLYMESDKLLQKVWVDTGSYTIKKILLKDKLLKQDMTITFDQYNSLQQKPFSYRRSIVINREAAVMKLQMQITKATVDEELSFPFEVNEKYKRE